MYLYTPHINTLGSSIYLYVPLCSFCRYFFFLVFICLYKSRYCLYIGLWLFFLYFHLHPSISPVFTSISIAICGFIYLHIALYIANTPFWQAEPIDAARDRRRTKWCHLRVLPATVARPRTRMPRPCTCAPMLAPPLLSPRSIRFRQRGYRRASRRAPELPRVVSS
jgi:hypothetical protein